MEECVKTSSPHGELVLLSTSEPIPEADQKIVRGFLRDLGR